MIMELADFDFIIREMVLIGNRSHLYVSEALKAKFPDISREYRVELQIYPEVLCSRRHPPHIKIV